VVGVVTSLCIGTALVTASAVGGASAARRSGAEARRLGADTPPVGVDVRVFAFEDASRATPADPEGQTPVSAATTRALPTVVYLPPGEGRHPVILFSHGSPGGPGEYAPILERWATEGYVVVAPTYPVSSLAGPDPVTAGDQRDQVRDARFVLDLVLALDRVPEAAGGLGDRLDRHRIAAVGHSLGGLTTLALVSDCCRDRRVRAAVVLSGVSVNEPGPAIGHPSGPILFAHAPLDIAVPMQQSELAYSRASRPKYFLEIRYPLGGVVGHIVPYFPGGGRVSMSVARVVDDFLVGYLEGQRSGRARMVVDARADRYLRLRARR
jgi:dienelactone hydrolase